METVAVITDIHSNLPALEAALARVDELAPDAIYCGGDLVGYGPWPNEVCRLIEERGIPTIYGNYDYAIGRDEEDCSCAYITLHDRELGQRSVDWTLAHTDQRSKGLHARVALRFALRAGVLARSRRRRAAGRVRREAAGGRLRRAMKYVLFVCIQNAGRSQMAQAFFERYAPGDIRAESARLEPAGQVHPTVVEAMKEIGIDISERRPKKLTVEMQLHADLAVTLGCGGRCPYVAAHVEDWDLPDPASRPLEEVRAIRDEIGGRVDDLLLHRAEEIRADRTAHELRLQKVLPGLIAEFEGMRRAQEIRECTDAVLSSFDDAKIRSHVATLAERRAGDCLGADHCYELEAAR